MLSIVTCDSQRNTIVKYATFIDRIRRM